MRTETRCQRARSAWREVSRASGNRVSVAMQVTNSVQGDEGTAGERGCMGCSCGRAGRTHGLLTSGRGATLAAALTRVRVWVSARSAAGLRVGAIHSSTPHFIAPCTPQHPTRHGTPPATAPHPPRHPAHHGTLPATAPRPARHPTFPPSSPLSVFSLPRSPTKPNTLAPPALQRESDSGGNHVTGALGRVRPRRPRNEIKGKMLLCL